MSFNKVPFVKVNQAFTGWAGWADIAAEISKFDAHHGGKIIVVECYQGVLTDDLITQLRHYFPEAGFLHASVALRDEDAIRKLTFSDVTDDRIFGYMTGLHLSHLFDAEKIRYLRDTLPSEDKLTFLIGTGASLVVDHADLYIYADMPRWEIQLRMRRNLVANIGLSNYDDPFETQYKRGYFLDWRLCDHLKRTHLSSCQFVLDTTNTDDPKMITYDMLAAGMEQAVQQPFSVVPFFDPGPWGGQWMKEKFELDPAAVNYAWGFNCVPEENSLILDFNGLKFETPSINLVLFKAQELLGTDIRHRFGDEFPIRFDFLDTIQGGNLSLQVHPLTSYIRDKFGLHYTQDESYYMLDAAEDATVYLGLKDGVDGKEMISKLQHAQLTGIPFNADDYSLKWPARKHDHFLIPAGTVHCSGSGCMVLEISATPYIFTFKLWDWGRLGMDGKPRAINIDHGISNIQWDRQSEWTRNNLINRVETVAHGAGWREERTGLHALEFIETRRFWQTGEVNHHTNGTVNVLMIVEGEQAEVESPSRAFETFVVNYAEAFIVPARVGDYTIRPVGASKGKEIAVIKAYVRN